MRARWRPALVASILLAPVSATAADARYSALLADGSRHSANDVANWHDPAQQPAMGGKPLFDSGNPFRWMTDNTKPLPAAPPAYVEFTGGDVLPGEVVAHRSGTESPGETWPDQLLVRPAVNVAPPDGPADEIVRVSTEWVQRVVWTGPEREYRPATAFLRDGRQLAFRALRWTDTGVSLLTEDGIRPVPFPDLAQAHLPRRNPWDAHFEQLAALIPSGDGRLVLEEATDGLRVTVSTERLRPQFRGDRNKPESWLHVVQPAWSLDPLWVRFGTLRGWRFCAPHEVPLSQLAPAAVKQESIFGSGWRWQRDRNVQGQALRSNGTDFAWGFGVQAHNELSFELHPALRSFRAQVGIDQAAGDGGCARGLVSIETDQRRPAFQSNVIVGSKTIADTGNIPLAPAADNPGRLVLVADPVLEGRPAGADPFDIRDLVDWLQPELTLDPAEVKREIARRAFDRIAPLAGFSVSPAERDRVRLVNHWDESHPRDPRFRLLLTSDLPFVVASKKVRIDRDHRWLAVGATRPPTRVVPSRVQVRIDGAALGEFDVPAHASPMPSDPALIPVERFHGKTVTVELVQIGDTPDAAVDWRVVALLKRRPGLIRLFEDEAAFAGGLNTGDGEAAVVPDAPYRGKASLRVAPPQKGNPRLPGIEAAIREYPDFGEYRYLRFAWKKDGGTQLALGLAHDGQFGGDEGRAPRARAVTRRPFGRVRGSASDDRGLRIGYRYDAGKGAPLSGAALRLGGPEANWNEITRDLYADCGAFTLTGLEFHCPDGTAAWFDHIYLARTLQDFESVREYLPGAAEPPLPVDNPNIAALVNPAPAGKWDYAAVTEPVAPRFATAAFGDGTALMKEFRGRQTVLRTATLDNKLPCTLRAAVRLPDSASRLELSVSHYPETEWALEVKVNGQKLDEKVINATAVPNEWLDLAYDLSAWKGQGVVITVDHRPHNGQRQNAYFSRVAVTTPE